ncbi:MAG: YHS domain-containing protein [Planctomycetota bacterium]|jgi:YHS domain-containing protein
MKTKGKLVTAAWLFAGVLLVGLTLLQGCSAVDPTSPRSYVKEKQESNVQNSEAMITHEPAKQIAQAEQTTCPLMGMAIDKDVHTEYKGKKVYFCCASCIGGFKENPEKYIAKLPQFSK